jgi:hypothetical protein
MPKTYEPIATNTLSSAAASVTFSSIPLTYTDLVIVSQIRSTRATGTEDYGYFYFNGDTTLANYGRTIISGDGTTAGSAQFANPIGLTMPVASATSTYNVNIFNIMNYSNSTTYKTVLERNSFSGGIAYLQSGLWKNTAAITSIQFAPYYGPNFASGSSFTIYGIKAA